MSTINKAKYLSLLVLLGAWGCTTNQYVSRSGGGYDDLYGGDPNAGIVTRDRGADQQVTRSDNPDYAYTGDYAESGTSDYYDESYLSSRSVKRAVSSDVGYNSGFTDGYNLATANTLPYYGGLGSYWPGSAMNVGFQFGFGNSLRIRPYLGFGFGMGSMLGYSPWGYGGMGYGSMMGYGYDPFGYNSFYSPWGYNNYGYGMYDSYYGGYGGYGYNPWAYNRPVIVVNNNYERGVSRTYGPRVAGTGSRSRSNERYNANGVNTPRSATTTGNRGSRSSNAVSANETYSSPRSARNYGRGGAGDAGGRTSAESYGSRGSSSGVDGGNVYYSRPRSSGASNYSSESVNSGNYASPRSSRGTSGNTYSAPSYSAPSRSQSDYSAPTRSYSAPSRSSESYSAPSRTYSAPSNSAPSRSYSAPSSSGSSGGGGGATRSSSRGPR
jgi:hypothetical protein